MKGNNICKFPTSAFDRKVLSVSCFVRESDANIMKNPVKLTSNRMAFCIDGSGALIVDGSAFPLSKGTLAFCFADETVMFENRGDLAYMYIDFFGERADALLSQFGIFPLSRAYDGFDGLIPIWSESLFRASEKTIELVAESILLYTFSRISDETGSENSLVGQIVHLTEKNFKNPNLGISYLAKELSYNPKYISHLFKSRTRASYSEYLRSLRLKYATTLFDHGLDSVKNVALLSGFSDPLYFSNVFKKNIGVSPREYIENIRNKNKL